MIDTSSASPDFERSFGGLRRLYGAAGAQRVFDMHAVVVGIGGVGSWVAEAFARSGARRISLIDLDHVSESNINRQLHATVHTIGHAKIEAMRQRIASINPACHVDLVDDFVDAGNWSDIVAQLGLSSANTPLAVVDACDQVRAKAAMAVWAIAHNCTFVSVGAAGGKCQAHLLQVDDLAQVTHDPLLAQLRYRLRKHHNAPRAGRMKVACVFSRESVRQPAQTLAATSGVSQVVVHGGPAEQPLCAVVDDVRSDGSLNCHGYGSSVAVTAAFGMAAAGWCMQAVAAAVPR